MSPLSFPPTRRGRDNLTWPRFIGALLLLGLIEAIRRSVA